MTMCKLVSPFCINILLHGTRHVANQNLLLVFCFEYQVGSSRCLSLRESIQVHLSTLNKSINRPNTKFYNSDDVNMIEAESWPNEARPTF